MQKKRDDIWCSNSNLLSNGVLTCCLISTALDKEGEAAPVHNNLTCSYHTGLCQRSSLRYLAAIWGLFLELGGKVKSRG